jgi:hypothetical protein
LAVRFIGAAGIVHPTVVGVVGGGMMRVDLLIVGRAHALADARQVALQQVDDRLLLGARARHRGILGRRHPAGRHAHEVAVERRLRADLGMDRRVHARVDHPRHGVRAAALHAERDRSVARLLVGVARRLRVRQARAVGLRDDLIDRRRRAPAGQVPVAAVEARAVVRLGQRRGAPQARHPVGVLLARAPRRQLQPPGNDDLRLERIQRRVQHAEREGRLRAGRLPVDRRAVILRGRAVGREQQDETLGPRRRLRAGIQERDQRTGGRTQAQALQQPPP